MYLALQLNYFGNRVCIKLSNFMALIIANDHCSFGNQGCATFHGISNESNLQIKKLIQIWIKSFKAE